MRKKISGSVFILPAALLCIFLLYLSAGGLCLVRHFTGIPCPGCGMTRAVLSVLHGDFRTAFAYHPLWVTLPLVAWLLLRAVFPRICDRITAFFCTRLHIKESSVMRAEQILTWLLLAAFLLVYIVRLACGWDGIQIA